MSGVGKGVTTASIAKILSSKGFKVSPIKIDPYLNVDAGTMNPIEHGEVFVLDSGLECDQDMGNYERFLDVTLPSENYMTTGMVYRHVIESERNLDYDGKCVEAVPHIPREILRRIDKSVRKVKADISIIEIGGTVGEYQNILFIEAGRILKLKNPDDILFVLVSYLPIPGTIGEMKTKPTQYAIRTLNSYGIQPDIVIARSSERLDEKRKEKIAVSSNIDPRQIISAPDVESIYEVPLNFEKDGLSKIILKKFGLSPRKRDLREWKRMVSKIKNAKEEVKIAVVGKYFKTGDFVLSDAYISVLEAIKHAAFSLGRKPIISWIDSTEYEKDKKKLKDLSRYDGILIPGGFGIRGSEGKILVIKYVRVNKKPYLGICFGMQLSVVEYARNVSGLKNAHSSEILAKTPHPVIDVIPDQEKKISERNLGGTMRLGGYGAKIKPGTIANRAYGKERIRERHRHRYEVNPKYIDKLEKKGLVFSGRSLNGKLMEIMELPQEAHPFFVGTQFHPEFTSSPLNPNPLFLAFIKACISNQKNQPKA